MTPYRLVIHSVKLPGHPESYSATLCVMTVDVAELDGAIAEEVRAQMARKRISGRQLARTLDWNAMYLSRRLSGQLPFTVADLYRIAAFLEVPLSALLPSRYELPIKLEDAA